MDVAMAEKPSSLTPVFKHHHQGFSAQYGFLLPMGIQALRDNHIAARKGKFGSLAVQGHKSAISLICTAAWRVGQ